MISFPSVSKWYRANHGAKDGIMVHSDWYHTSKVHLYTLASFGRHCLLYFLSKHMCKLQSKLLAHI